MKWTKQTAFDHICERFAEQKEASVDEDDSCMYRGPNGLKCAIGHLIPDNLYKKSIESENIWGLDLFNYLEIAPEETENSFRGFASAMQHAHDNAHSLKPLLLELTCVAKRFGLNSDKVSLITEWEGV